MDQFLQDLVSWIENLTPLVIYLVVLGISFAENILPPVPGDLVIVFAGYLVGLDQLSFAPSLFVAALGGGIGFMAMFWIGRRLGSSVLSPDRFKWVPKKRLRLALERVGKYGYLVVLANRFLPGLRSVISLATGMSDMKLWHTGLASMISAIAWSWIMVVLGKQLGENWEYVSVILKRYSLVILLLVVAVAVIQFVLYQRSRQSEEGEEA